MKKIIVLLSLACSLLFTLAACQPNNEPAQNLPVPASLTVGKYAVINYWATWCKPCREEIPELNKLAAEHSQIVDVYAINFDHLTGEALATATDDFGIEFAIADRDFGAALGINTPNVLPTTVIFDQNGQLLKTLAGPQTALGLLLHLQE